MRKSKGRWKRTKLIDNIKYNDWSGTEEECYKSEEYIVAFKKYWAKRNKWYKDEKKNNQPVLYKAERLLYYSRVRSKQKSIDNDLDKNWVLDRIIAGCVKTGLPFIFDSKRLRHPFSPSIDRIDNNKGYIKTNCQLVYWAYNTTKAEFMDDDIYVMAKAYLNKKKT